MKKKFKSQEGITLIALITTIIVMLILVAVTINMAINGGLFSYAGRATSETQEAKEEEKKLASGQVTVDGVLYNSIDDYIEGKPMQIHNWTRTGDTFTCSHCNATYTMGDAVNYTPEGKVRTTITAQMSGIDNYYEKHLEYPGSANLDTNGDQIVIRDTTTPWIVLGIEDTDGDDIYETLLITTQREVYPATSKYLYFYGAEAYNNAVDEINRVCKELYSNSEYGNARGMTIEDVNNALNYTPEYEQIKIKDSPNWEYIIENGTYTPDGTNTPEALGEYEVNGYDYSIDADTGLIINNTNNITEIERNVIFGAGENKYFLASRGVRAHFGVANFGAGAVYNGNAGSYEYFFNSYGNEGIFDAGFRPVVSLKSKLPEKSTEQIEWEEWNPPILL